jgi:predicted phosphodiesterase
MTSVLVIGDAHVDDIQDLSRFKALGNMILDRQPEYIISIGDYMSMDCLSEWDRNKRALMENRRYSLEIEAGNQSLDMMLDPIKKFNKKSKKKAYTPSLVYIKGNHENRLDRYLESDPTFLGTVSLEKDLYLYHRGFEVIDYKEVYTLEGVSFTHIPIASNGKAISNPTVAQKALRLFSGSVVFGHTHTLDHAAEHRHGAPHLNQALCVGCFFEDTPTYAVGSKTDYWSGIIELDIYGTNRFDITTTSMSQLKGKYS